MTDRRVFVIWKSPLFYEALRLLLLNPQIELAGATSDYAAAPEKIANLYPDTILIEEEANDRPQVTDLLKSSPTGVRVISLCLSNNELNVYHREHRTVVQAGDLLHLILTY